MSAVHTLVSVHSPSALQQFATAAWPHAPVAVLQVSVVHASESLQSATVTADSEMRLLVLNAREFATLLDDHPSVRRNVLAAVASRLREAEQPAPSH